MKTNALNFLMKFMNKNYWTYKKKMKEVTSKDYFTK